MLQPMDPLSQLALCCGFGGRRKEFKGPRSYFYSPSTGHLNPYAPQPQYNQPYFLLTQPVIITGNTASSQTNTMTLVQHAQAATNGTPFPAISLIASPAGIPQQPAIVSSQCAIYSSPAAALNTSLMNGPSTSIYESRQISQDHCQNKYLFNQSSMLPITNSSPRHQQQDERGAVTLSSEVFRQLEIIEKQIDLTRDMELIERHGIVITRAIDPYSLMPHLTETTLRRYHNHFLFNDNYVIRFIEIIKRPGQTLGLYIRTVQFEMPKGGGSRPGLVITKIDTDSPIYNSLVLHVGDEILSINLVDVQGMSLDDVVIIMSIPKRLVLALRIPKDRDQLLNINLIQHQQQQQHQLFRASTSGVLRDNTMLGYNQKLPINNARNPFSYNLSSSSRTGLHVFNETQENEMRREMSQRTIKPDQDLHHARPFTVHSANQMNETLIEYPDEVDCQNTTFEEGQRRSYSSTGYWPSQGFDSKLADRINMNMSQQQPHERRLLNQQQFEQTARVLSKSREDLSYNSVVDNNNNNFQDHNFEFNSNSEKSERATLNKDRTLLESDGNHQLVSYNNHEAGTSYPTLPRRTLPNRSANIVASTSPTTTTKPPVLSNLRLADTPEQSSYFSSSIDAINRELKELRRQRMALSNNDPSVDPTNSYL